MKTIFATSLLLIGVIFNLSAQEKNDSLIKTEQQTVNMDDIIAALEISGIQIFKFNTGDFDRKLELIIQLEEYSADTLKQKVILYEGKNWFNSYKEKQLIERFVDQLRIITKKGDNNCILSIDLQGTTLDRQFSIEKTYDRQFFLWRPYAETNWALNKKVPLMAYISSWRDKKGYIRHCGVRRLKNNSEDTDQFFSNSPNYFILSYIAKEL